jgi:hypothetical protein
MSARAAVSRLSTRSDPSLSSRTTSSSPARIPSRRRRAAGKTNRPRSSSLAVPHRPPMWEIIPLSPRRRGMGRKSRVQRSRHTRRWDRSSPACRHQALPSHKMAIGWLEAGASAHIADIDKRELSATGWAAAAAVTQH